MTSKAGALFRRLIDVTSIVCLATACAGGTPTPAPTRPAFEAAPPEATLTSEVSLRQPALTSMAVAARALTITPSPPGPRPAATKTPASGEMEIIVGDYYFNPQVVTVTVDTLVYWVPEGVLYHTIVSSASPPVFSGGTAGSGTRYFKHTFRRPGVYEYHCDYHPGAMNAVIVVIDGN